MDIRLHGHLRGPVTPTPVAERLADDLKDLRRSRLGFVHPTSNAVTDRAISAEWRTFTFHVSNQSFNI